jgi:hypothetical protein
MACPARAQPGHRRRERVLRDLVPLGRGELGTISVDAVACRSAHSCIAAGNYSPDGQELTFAEAWNGSTWSLQSIDLPSGAIDSALLGASCAAPHCVAVGAYSGPSGIPVTLAVAPRS